MSTAALQASLDLLAALASTGDADAAGVAEALVRELMARAGEPLPGLLLPPLLDTLFYLKQNRADLAAEYIDRARTRAGT